MAKVQALNFLLELAQKELHGIRPTTMTRYKRELAILLSTGENQLGYLWQYQAGMEEVVESLSRFIDGACHDFDTLVEYVVEKNGRLQAENENIVAIHSFSGDEAELGKMLICDQLYKLDLSREDFAKCDQCSNIYAKKSKKSRFCTHLCNVNYNKAGT